MYIRHNSHENLDFAKFKQNFNMNKFINNFVFFLKHNNPKLLADNHKKLAKPLA